MADLTLNPCSACVAQAAYTKMLLSSDSADFTKSGGKAYRLHFIGERLKKYVRLHDNQRITGDLWRLPTSMSKSQSFVYGPVYFAMNAAEMAVLAPYLVGALDSGTAGSGLYEPDTCPAAFHMLILRDYGIFKITNCYVSSFRVDSRALQFGEDSLADMVVLQVNIIAADRTLSYDEAGWPVADEPELGTTAAYSPYFYRFSSLSLRATDFSNYCKSVKMSVNKNLRPRYRMSTTPTAFCSYGREVDLEVGMDWNATTKVLLEQATNPAGSVTFANDAAATCSTQFLFSALIAEDEDPSSEKKGEDVSWKVRNVAAASDPASGDYDIEILNDSAV